MKVAITIRSFNVNNPLFNELKNEIDIIYMNITGRRLSQDEIISVAKEANAVIAGTELYTKEVIRNLNNLKIISRVGIGIDNIDQDYAKKRNIKIYNTPEAPVSAVAEHTISLIFDLLKKISDYNLRIRKNDPRINTGLLIEGKTIGIVGLGRIGKQVGKLLECMGCSIVFYDPFISESSFNQWTKYDNLNDLISNSDIVTLHAIAQDNNRPLLGREELSYFNKNKFLINTARGSLIDEVELVKLIEEGNIGGLGLDVFSDELVDKIYMIIDSNIILTPHVASNTYESRIKMESEAMMNILMHMND